jgi:hypothetical protein
MCNVCSVISRRRRKKSREIKLRATVELATGQRPGHTNAAGPRLRAGSPGGTCAPRQSLSAMLPPGSPDRIRGGIPTQGRALPPAPRARSESDRCFRAFGVREARARQCAPGWLAGAFYDRVSLKRSFNRMSRAGSSDADPYDPVERVSLGVRFALDSEPM